ncbi:competence/damage-inducible protein A [Oxalicibacterium solurbis]|uniref:Damage-inducible protein n=1 Tax=Oxalicibacterium solurbis TaxID=69280 RepID=A0A8J3AUM1_9BURK|nr:competence/damage-inducible protein A [Oxalicibacterium solurbis]GGI53525.1 damage-inducible protein [Oxalicibacterium solurbis]
MAFGLIIIGDEILSGKRVDKHFAKVVELLTTRGLSLSWSECIGDDPARITATLKRTFASDDVVFSCGGIGATPDDHTRQCAAAALGVPLVLHPQAQEKIRERMLDMAREAKVDFDPDRPENLHRLKMGEFPQGADIVPNPYNKIPGFAIRHGNGGAHYFLPGFPVMAWPMIEWALDTHYAHLFHQRPHLEKSVLVFEAMESALTPLMETIERAFPAVKVFSLPSVGDAQTRRHIELGVKGEPQQAEEAFAALLAGLESRGCEIGTA